MKSTLLSIIILFSAIALQAQQKEHHYSDSTYACTYNMSNGLFDGKYVSYYSNGIKKCEGEFANNQRIGSWSVWDTIGKLVMIREYKNNFDYVRVFPQYPKEGPYKLLSTLNYTLKYNADSVITPFYVAERAVFYAKRLWSSIYFKDNSPLFNAKQVYDTLVSAFKSGSLRAYSDEDFMKELKFKDTAQVFSNNIIGFNIKEDFFFESDLLMSDTRIIGFSPIYKNGNDNKETIWFYYPECRKTLAKIRINKQVKPCMLKTMEDVFFFRYFSSEIYKEENVFDRAVEKSKIKEENTRISLSLINAESDIWLYINK